MSIPFVLIFRHFELNSVSTTVPGIPCEYPASIHCAMVLEILLNHVSCNNDFALGANLAPSDDAFRNRPTRIYRRAMHHDIGPQYIFQINLVDMLLFARTSDLYNFCHNLLSIISSAAGGFHISEFSTLISVPPQAGKPLLSAFHLLPTVLCFQPLRLRGAPTLCIFFHNLYFFFG